MTTADNDGRLAPHEPARLPLRDIAAASIGNALEFYDFSTFAFFAIQIGRTYFPSGSAFLSLMGALATFGAGFLTRPIGALVLGGYADRAGRKPAMVLSFTLMGCAIAALALTPGYARIGAMAPLLAITARLVQGFALGGEVGSASAYMLEAAPLRHRGLALSLQSVSQGVSSLTGTCVGLILSTLLTSAALQSYGWRIALLIGVVTLPFGLYIRRRLPETLHLAEPEGLSGAVASAAIRDHLRLILLACAVIAGGTIATYTVKYLVTYGQATLHLTARLSFTAQLIGTLVGIVLGPMAGALSDRFGRKPVMLWPFVTLLFAVLPLFRWVAQAHDATSFVTANVALSLLTGIGIAPFYALVTESLPKAIRTRVFASIYAITVALFGGTTQLVLTWLIHVSGDPLAPAWYLTAAAAVSVAAIAMMTESAPAKQLARAGRGLDEAPLAV